MQIAKDGEDWFQSFDERAESDLYHITGREMKREENRFSQRH